MELGIRISEFVFLDFLTWDLEFVFWDFLTWDLFLHRNNTSKIEPFKEHFAMVEAAVAEQCNILA